MDKLEQILKAVADHNRIRILKLLEGKPMCVCELAFVLDITQPAVSRNLKKMIGAGLIESEKNGFWTNYFARPDTDYARMIVRSLKGWLEDDVTVKSDRVKAKKADREKLCCPK